jgi:endonuclease YncB( thermonuclease family)
VAAAAVLAASLASGSTPPAAGASDEEHVVRVLDGDSVVLADGRQVRYLGINAPEAGEPLSEAARALNRRLVEGKQVRLVSDRERTDGYGRLLAYVYVGDTLVNAELLRAGLAHLFVFGRLRHEKAFADHEREARAARRGLWAGAARAHTLRITAPRRGRSTRAPSNARAVTICNVSGAGLDLAGFSLDISGSRVGHLRFPRVRLAPGHVALVVAEGSTGPSQPGEPPRFRWWPRTATGRGPATLTLATPRGEPIDRVELMVDPAVRRPRRGRRPPHQRDRRPRAVRPSARAVLRVAHEPAHGSC